jgi:endoglucanase
MNIHHRQSYADHVIDPVPGLLVGGPHSGWEDKCVYPSKYPAKSYLDEWCSYSTNEVAINWNAALVYVLAAVQSLQ